MKKRKFLSACLALLLLLLLFTGCEVSDQTPSGNTNNGKSDNAQSDDTNNAPNESVSNEGADENTQIDGLNNYNAVLYDNAVKWIDGEFIKDNPVAPEKILNYPTKRVFIVDSQEKYDQMFLENIADLTLDFNEQMIVAYTFYDENLRENTLANANVEDDVLKITYEDVPPFIAEPGVDPGDSCQPYQRWFVVTLDKIDVDSVIFERKQSGK